MNQRQARQYHIEEFHVVATPVDFRVDIQFKEFKDPIPGPSFPTLEQAKDHIALTQQQLNGRIAQA